ncbi:hypothetical protein [Aequorivita sp. CIP111184]|uniref:hypothetical protein n=1 Tax=Aequorivita sp. CIP111184 TaxID=2211356 RepID=UPI000DBC1794|nr:hypothetical protein [Aequorivita sp. CIP111184]SRX54226.1 hypothetical protein AEQU1_01233 [Aequorivita sp. CIP111184]
MEKNYLIFFKICLLLLLTTSPAVAQVGIGTTTPKGALDIESTQYGVVYPSVALTATNAELPVLNPTTDPLEVGTTVYNTNTTSNGSFDVEPGIYSWNGSLWVRHYYKRQVEGFKQTAVLRSSSNGGWEVVTGFPITSPKTFFSKYTGQYKIELKLDYGGGAIIDNADVNVALFEGDFRFTFEGTPYLIRAKSYSTFNKYIGTAPGTQFSNISSQVFKTIYVNLVASTIYTFSLEFDQFADPDPALNIGFLNNGNNSGVIDGRGYVGKDIPCIIEFTYLKE